LQAVGHGNCRDRRKALSVSVSRTSVRRFGVFNTARGMDHAASCRRPGFVSERKVLSGAEGKTLKAILILFLHIGFDAIFGWCLLNFRRHDRSAVETLLAGSLLGIYVETLSTATLMFLGV